MSIVISNPNTNAIGQNYFKNPAFSVIQRIEAASGAVNNSLAVPTASLGYPGETEWCIAASGGSPGYAFSSVNQSLTLTGVAGTTAIYVLQRIESTDANRLQSKQVTLSVELSNNLLGSVTWELFRPTTTANTHGTISSPTQTLIASGTWTITSTLTRYSATLPLPTGVSNGLEVRIKVGAQTSGTWVIARPKLEEGFAATAFACEDIAVELVKCQRYFRALSDYFIMYYTTVNTFRSEVPHPNMFGTTRIRTSIAQNSINGAGVTVGAGLNEDVTRVTYVNNAGTGYYGGNPDFTVAAHIA
jgi:hypothetical protein